MSKRPFLRAIAIVAILFFTISLASAQTTTLFKAESYGTYGFVGSTVVLGRTAPVGFGSGCGLTQTGMSRSGTVFSVNALPLAMSGVIDTHASDTSSASTSSASATDVNLLSGVITGHLVKAVSTTYFSSGFHTTGSGSSLLSVSVSGHVFNSVPAPNTTIQLSGIGYVVLNEQHLTLSGSAATFSVNMIHVYVTLTNYLGIKPGTQIIVSHASSGMTRVMAAGALDGYAFGTKLSILNRAISSSPTAPVNLPCAGTAGATKQATIAGVNVPGFVASYTIDSTGDGIASGSTVKEDLTNRLQSVNVLNSLVRASVVTASAHASLSSGVVQTSSAGSGFVSLVVSGHPEITASVAANTQINIAGLGTLYFRRVIKSSNYIEVRMIELVINQSNSLGLAIGSRIQVGVAHAGINHN
jgi:hypothetical protein